VIEEGPVLVVAGDAEHLDPVLRAHRLDGLEVSVRVRAVAEPQVTQLVGNLHVTALSEPSDAVDSRRPLALQVTDQPHHHSGDPDRPEVRLLTSAGGCG
jgi:hypothetical protein